MRGKGLSFGNVGVLQKWFQRTNAMLGGWYNMDDPCSWIHVKCRGPCPSMHALSVAVLFRATVPFDTVRNVHRRKTCLIFAKSGTSYKTVLGTIIAFYVVLEHSSRSNSGHVHKLMRRSEKKADGRVSEVRGPVW